MWFINEVKPHKHLSPLALSGRVEQPTWEQPNMGQPNIAISPMRWF